MKKTFIGMVVGMMIMSCVGFIGYKNITNSHEAELVETKTEYEYQIRELEEKNSKTEKKYEKLENQVYNVMEGKNYDFAIAHDGITYDYSKTGKGLFKEKTRMKRIVYNVKYKRRWVVQNNY